VKSSPLPLHVFLVRMVCAVSNVVYGGVLCAGNSKSEAHMEIATVLR
jgi:hypothetical protein